MAGITLSKTEYERLTRQAEAYRRLAQRFFEAALYGSAQEVVDDFKQTKLYTDEFINDLETGLKKSSYGKKHGRKAAAA